MIETNLTVSSALRERVRIAGLNATIARRSLDIWWTYVGPNNEPRHIKTMNDYPHFFRADKQAHLVMAVVGLVTLFDTSDNTVTVKHIVHKACEEGVRTIKPYRSKVDSYGKDQRVVGLTHLRNKLFAHRDRDASYDETFREAEVRPMDMFDLSDETFEIINAVTDATGAKKAVHDTIAGEHAEAMLAELRR